MPLAVDLGTLASLETEEDRRERERRERAERVRGSINNLLSLVGMGDVPAELGRIRDEAGLVKLDRGYEEAAAAGLHIKPETYHYLRMEYQEPGALASAFEQGDAEGIFWNPPVRDWAINRLGSIEAVATHMRDIGTIASPDYWQIVSEIERQPGLGAVMDALGTMAPQASEWQRFFESKGLEALSIPERAVLGGVMATSEDVANIIRQVQGRETVPDIGWPAVFREEDMMGGLLTAHERGAERVGEVAPGLPLAAEIGLGVVMPAGAVTKVGRLGKAGREAFATAKAMGLNVDQLDDLIRLETKIASKPLTGKESVRYRELSKIADNALPKPGEDPRFLIPEDVGAAARNVAEMGVQPVPGGDPVERFAGLLRQTGDVRKEVVAARAQEASRRAARMIAIRDDPALTPMERAVRMRGVQKGEMPSGAIEPFFNQFAEDDLAYMLGRIQKHQPWQGLPHNVDRAQMAFLDMGGKGILPTASESELLAEVFGVGFGRAIDSARKVPPDVFRNIVTAANIPRTILASYDLSAPLRQGIMLAPGHPLIFANSMARMFRVWAPEAVGVGKFRVTKPGWLGPVGEEALDITTDAMMKDDWWPTMKKAGLYQAREGLATAEEAMLGAPMLRKWLPGIRMSERAYNVFLNKLRFDVFKSVAKSWQAGKKVVIDEDYKDLARFINYATGRGSYGRMLDRSMPFWATIQFSPRFTISRPQAFLKMIIARPLVRQQAIRDMGLFIGSNIALLSLFKLSGFADVELNALSSDFGKIKIGKTRIDLWGGSQPFVRYAVQAAFGARKARSGRVYDVNRMKVLGRLGWSKASPQAGVVADVLIGSTFIGDEMTADASGITTQMWNRLAPMAFQDLVDAIRLEGPVGALVGPLAFFGLGAQTYETLYERLAEAQALSRAELNFTDEEVEFNRAKRLQVNETPRVQEILKALDDDIRQHGGSPEMRLSTFSRQKRAEQEFLQGNYDDRYRESDHPLRFFRWREDTTALSRDTYLKIEAARGYEEVEYEDRDIPEGSVDWTLERWYAVDPADFMDEDGETDWAAFNAAQVATLDDPRVTPETRAETLEAIRQYWSPLKLEMWEKEQQLSDYRDIPEQVFQEMKAEGKLGSLGEAAPSYFVYRNAALREAGVSAKAQGYEPEFGRQKRFWVREYRALQTWIERRRTKWRRGNPEGVKVLIELAWKAPSARDVARFRPEPSPTPEPVSSGREQLQEEHPILRGVEELFR